MMMLYTFAKTDYDSQTLQRYFAHFHSQDCVVLWQDGVLLPLKYPEFFAQLSVPCYALENDIYARNLQEIAPHFVHSDESKVRLISLQDFVILTERYFPQLAI
ncbi:DsrH/TusB family sulfur relay protein [Avibacterium avium]|uniref:DsrH/TusB family sulfur relay protein n=1 Tax=Avibacterium avium TaxID=751 RepID=UPI003BF8A05C